LVTISADGLAERVTAYPDVHQARAAAERLAEERGKPVSGESTTPGLLGKVRQTVEAFGRRDIDGVLDFYAPDAIWDSSAIGIGVHDGRDAVRELLEDWLRAYDAYEQAADELRDLGNGVTFVVIVQRARPAGGDRFVEFRFAAVTIWEDGLVERVTTYLDIDQARAAAERLAEERG
jgi:hypothetical protein